MLTIRDSQLQALNADVFRRFVDDLIDQVAASYPDHHRRITRSGQDMDPLRTFIHEGVERATGYGVKAREDVTRYIELMIEIDPAFDELPSMRWARTILESKNITGHGKMALISRRRSPNPKR